ncbi:MAG TPA: membrane transporter protein [Terriglobia bacterium]|nr:membrane transporter protein [Terriglobia bacterium]
MDLKLFVRLVLQGSIVLTVFGFGLKSEPGDLRYVWRRPGLLLRSLVSALVVMPFFAVLLTRAFDFRPAAEIALMALAISPVPPLLPRRLARDGGQSAYALSLMLTLAILSIVTVPLSAEVLARFFSRSVEAPLEMIVRIVLLSVVAPLGAGVAIRHFLPSLAKRIAGTVALAAGILLPLALAPLLIVTWRSVWAEVGDGTLLAMVAFVIVGLTVGHLLGGPDPDNSSALALASACRHPAIALMIASANFPEERFGGTILLYLIVSAVVAAPYLSWRRKPARIRLA